MIASFSKIIDYGEGIQFFLPKQMFTEQKWKGTKETVFVNHGSEE